MRITIIVLSLGFTLSSAHAACRPLADHTYECDSLGEPCPVGELCHLRGSFTLPIGGTVTANMTPPPKCPDDYTLMMDQTMRPKCARDIIDPVK